MYLSMAKIKLDNQKYGASNALLYKDFDVFSSDDKIESEAELLGSHLLIRKALDRVQFDITINRIGSIKNTSLYKNSPIDIEYNFIDTKLFDVLFKLTITENNLVIKYENNGVEVIKNGKLCTIIVDI